jgi:antitoxin component of MazEF toxin-antitoxin module
MRLPNMTLYEVYDETTQYDFIWGIWWVYPIWLYMRYMMRLPNMTLYEVYEETTQYDFIWGIWWDYPIWLYMRYMMRLPNMTLYEVYDETTQYEFIPNTTFNNISVISWRSVLLVEESGVTGENRWPVASH